MALVNDPNIIREISSPKFTRWHIIKERVPSRLRSPRIKLANVLFPAPLRPRMASFSPGLTSRLIPARSSSLF